MATDLALTVQDEPGVLAALGEALGKGGVNIEGVSGSGAGAGSIVHLLVEDAGAARSALANAGFRSIEERDVVVVPVADRPGALGEIARLIAAAGVNLDLVYLATGPRLVLGARDLEAIREAI